MNVYIPMGKVYRTSENSRQEFFGWREMNIFVKKYLPAYQMLTEFEVIEKDGSVRAGEMFDFIVIKDAEVFLLKKDLINEFRINT